MKVINPYRFSTPLPLYAWLFDGTTEGVRADDEWLTQGGSTNDFSFSMWIKTSSNDMRVFGCQYGSLNFFRIMVESSGFISLIGRKGGFIFKQTGSIIVNDGLAHHIFIDRTPTEYRVYVDGVEDINYTNSNIVYPERIGVGSTAFATGMNSNGFTGKMTDVFGTSTSLGASAAPIIYNGGTPRNELYFAYAPYLLFYIRGNDSTNVASGVTDLSGNGNDFTMTNMEDSDIVLW